MFDQYTTFHKVLDYLESFQTQSPILNTFAYGNLIDFGQQHISGGTVQYPFMFAVPQSIQYDDNITTYQFSLIFADILNWDLTNEKDCVSDMSLEARRFLSYIKRGINTFPELYDNMDVVLPANAIPFFERFGDHVAGVAMDVQLQVFEDLNACDYYVSATPTPSNTATPTTTPTVTPTRDFFYYDILLCSGGVGPFTKIRSNDPIPIGSSVTLAAIPTCYEVISLSDSSGSWVSNFNTYSDCASCPPPTPTNTPTQTLTSTPTLTPTETITPTPTFTPTATYTPTPTGVFVDPDAAAYLADVITSGGTIDATISAATNTLYTDLKNAGLYNKLEIFYPLLGANSASMSIEGKLQKTYDIQWNGGWTFDVSGATGNGIDTWGDSNFNNGSLTSWSRHYSVYSVIQETNAGYDIGSVENGIICGYGNNSFYALLDGTNYSPVNVGTTRGFYIANEPSQNVQGGFHNGVKVINTTLGSVKYNVDIYFGAKNNNGVVTERTRRKYAWFSVGSHFTDGEALTFSNIINAFQTSLGRNTY
jgi:hypothetical protein